MDVRNKNNGNDNKHKNTKIMKRSGNVEGIKKLMVIKYTVEEVAPYDYIGSIIVNGKTGLEALNIIGETMQIYYQINNKMLRKKKIINLTKMRVYNSIVLPLLLVGRIDVILKKDSAKQNEINGEMKK